MTSPISNQINFSGGGFYNPNIPRQDFDGNLLGAQDDIESNNGSTGPISTDTFVSYRRINLGNEDLEATRSKKKANNLATMFLDLAEAILRGIKSIVTMIGIFINPVLMIARYTQGSRLAQIVKTYTEAAMAAITVRGDPDLLHRALDIDTRAAYVRGEFDQSVDAWKNALVENKQAEKDTHDLIKK